MKVERKDVYEFVVVFTEDEFEKLCAVSTEYHNTPEEMLLWLVDNAVQDRYETLD